MTGESLYGSHLAQKHLMHATNHVKLESAKIKR